MDLYLTLPQSGETIQEGVLVSWLKKEGDFVEEKELLLEYETEKSVFTFESPFRGFLKKILVQPNASVPVGARLALFEVSAEDGERYLNLGVGIPEEFSEKQLPSTMKDDQGVAVSQSHEKAKEQGSASYSPLIRKLAQEHQISFHELDQIPHRSIRLTEKEFLHYLQNRNKISLAKKKETPFILSALEPVRRRIAQHLYQSHQTIPQALAAIEIDFTRLLQLRKNQSSKISLLAYCSFYAVQVLRDFPNLNAHWFEEKGQLFLKKFNSIHLGVAIDHPRGLVTPVLHSVEDWSLEALHLELEKLKTQVVMQQLPVQALTGATFLINNPGSIGGSRSMPLLPAPLVAMLTLNQIQRKPWVMMHHQEEAIAIRSIGEVSLTFDHRAFDGAEAIRFLNQFKQKIEGLSE